MGVRYVELPVDGGCNLILIGMSDKAFQFRLQMVDSGHGPRHVMHAPLTFWCPRSIMTEEDISWLTLQLVEVGDSDEQVECEQIDFPLWWLKTTAWWEKVAQELGIDYE